MLFGTESFRRFEYSTIWIGPYTNSYLECFVWFQDAVQDLTSRRGGYTAYNSFLLKEMNFLFKIVETIREQLKVRCLDIVQSCYDLCWLLFGFSNIFQP